jgi:hypothetical protein
MLLAADYPLLDIFWSMILFFAWVAWIWVLVTLVGDLFRRDDASGWVKAIWLLFLILVPFIGVFAYMLVNGDGMARRNTERAHASQAQFAGYGQTVAHTNGGAAGEIEKAKSLLDSGAITPAEFGSLKAKALA